MGKLSDILNNGTGYGNFNDMWNHTDAADEFGPIPSGSYVCHITAGELSNSRSGTPCYKLTFKVIEGEHTGRLQWLD